TILTHRPPTYLTPTRTRTQTQTNRQLKITLQVPMLHTFVALVQDKPGVLTRVASLFRRLNINIVSLTVGESERTDVSRMTIVFKARVVDLAPESIMLELTGSSSKIEGLIQVITESGYTILEVSRTGRMA